ncbi:NAD(P)-dependent oxidoreductase [Hominifimenecus sp. rT4P-3]|uniref:NAD(P)-dependent oxidoreductase n=1 Tax=Hominifimenecus sp. rT4P-3 TaxID=3242979 RepID=UPI003DA2E18C
MAIGFIGLGQMGKHMAVNMAACKEPMTVCNASGKGFDVFEKMGVGTTRTPKDLKDADLIFLCLPNTEVVEKVLFGENGLADVLHEGQIIVDFSTIKYKATLEIAEKCKALGAAFLDAPISGMETRAKEGTLTIMCGGEESVFEKVKPYLEKVGSKILYMGGQGCGQLTKLVNQLLFDINVAGLAEILPMAVKMGLDVEKVGQVVNSGTGRSYASEFFIPRIQKDNFSEGYSLNNAYKDLVSAAELGANLKIPMPVLASATTTYQLALLKGLGECDKGGMIRVYEELLGVKFRAD